MKKRYDRDERAAEANRIRNKIRTQDLIGLALTGLFAALCYVAVWVLRIPLVGTDQFLHLGNAVCLLAALLLGGWRGGLAGSIGMGLFDLFYYPSSLIKTLILKLGIGLIAGLVYAYGMRKERRNPHIGIALVSGGALAVGLSLLIAMLTGSFFGIVTWYAVGFLLFLGLSLAGVLAASVVRKSLSRQALWAIFGGSLGVFFNVVGEIAYKLGEQLLLGLDFNAAVTVTLAKIPATFLNASFSVYLAVALFLPLEKALQKAGLLSWKRR